MAPETDTRPEGRCATCGAGLEGRRGWGILHDASGRALVVCRDCSARMWPPPAVVCPACRSEEIDRPAAIGATVGSMADGYTCRGCGARWLMLGYSGRSSRGR